MVEDDPPQRAVVEFALAPLGIRTIGAGNLAEARRGLTENPDLVILDFYLPPEAGPDLLDDIPTDVPVLLVTASIETRVIMDKYPRITAALPKPVEPSKLRSTTASLLGLPDPS